MYQRTRRQGMVLVVVVIAIIMIAALGAGLLMSARTQTLRAQASQEDSSLMNIAEAGVAAAIADLKQGPKGSSGNLNSTSFGGGTFTTTTSQSGVYYTITATGSNGQWSRKVEVVVKYAASSSSLTDKAAIEANGPVTTSGNITVDGRDYSYDGASVVGAGVYGVASSKTVTRSGSSSIGGNGVAPSTSSNIYAQNYNWGPSGYPTSPDAALGLSSGTLKSWAQTDGTYFTSATDFTNYISTNGGVLPGGKVYYLNFDSLDPVNFGSQGSNSDPSILVMHNDKGTAEMKNFHGTFRGLLMTDYMTHINGDAVILGGVKSFANSTVGNDYGNGNAKVDYSSAILAKLPGDPSGGTYTKISWRDL